MLVRCLLFRENFKYLRKGGIYYIYIVYRLKFKINVFLIQFDVEFMVRELVYKLQKIVNVEGKFRLVKIERFVSDRM